MHQRAAGFAVSFAAHALVLLPAIGPFPANHAALRETPPSMKVVLVAPEDPDHPGLQADASTRLTTRIHPSGPLRIGTLRINLAKLADRASILFPTILPGLALDVIFPETAAPGAVRLSNPFAQPADSGRALPPLALSRAAVQTLIDRSWSRHDRWKAFAAIRDIVATHDGNDGAAPQVLFEYSQQNALQPFADSDRPDARIWAQIGLAADHADFIAFIRTYVAAHPHTKSSTELLFLLDQIVQADCDALALFVGPGTDARLQWTKAAQPDAFTLAAQLLALYRLELHRRGVTTPAALQSECANSRLRVLNAVLARTPGSYRAADARFLIGLVHWRERHQARAAADWTEGGSLDAPVYGAFLARIQEILRHHQFAPGSAVLDRSARDAIDRILDDVEMRWLMASSTRLRKFGYTFDSY